MTYVQERVVDPVVAHLGVYEQCDGVHLVAVEPHDALRRDLRCARGLPRGGTRRHRGVVF